MTRGYVPLTVSIGGLLAIASAVGTWPEAIPVTQGVALPFVALGVLTIALAGGVYLGFIPLRPASGVFILLGFALMGLGAYGYYHYLLDEITAILWSFIAFLGGGIFVIGGVAGWLEIDSSRFSRKTIQATLMTAVGFGGLVAVFIWGFILATIWILISGDMLDDMELIAISTISLGLGMATAAGLFLLGANRSRSFIDLRRPTLRDVAWTIGGLIGLFMALIAIAIVLEQLQAPSPEHDIVETVRDGDPNVLLYILIPASILIIGPGEELLFRNIVQKSLYDYFSRPGAVVVASVIFALVHIPAYGMAEAGSAVLVVFILSLLLGGIYARTENLVVPALIHGLYNALLFLFLYIELTMDEVPGILPGLII